MYRLVTDNSLEKKIYDRQVNKQGMSDRIVDELNPDAHLSSKEVHSLICDEAEDPEPVDMGPQLPLFTDPVMKGIVGKYGNLLTKVPFTHESLLIDRKDNKLSKAEKKLAERAYKLEKTSKITYSRPSYAAFYPKQGSFATNLHNPGSNGYTRNRYFEQGKRLDSWISPYAQSSRPMVSLHLPLKDEEDVLKGKAPGYASQDSGRTVDSAFPTPSFSNVLVPPPAHKQLPETKATKFCKSDESSSEGSSVIQKLIGNQGLPNAQSQKESITNSALEALTSQGVEIQQVVVPRDLQIPTNVNQAPLALSAGQLVTVIRTPKGLYLRMKEKIIKIKQHAAVNGLLGHLTEQPSSSTEGESSSHSVK